jgi:hypothetical protein
MADVLVIGGGAAGMMAAYAAAAEGARVTILEKNDRHGKKIYITGKGRCNVTNAADLDQFMRVIFRNPRFMYAAFATLDNRGLMALIEENGTPLKVERGERVFPVSDTSSDIISALRRALERAGISVRLNARVSELLLDGGVCGGVRLEDSTANPPCVCYERGNGTSVASGAKPGDQTLVLSGASVLRVRNYFRPYSESEDGGFGALTLSFSVPKDGWTAGVDSPVYANYLRGTSDNKMFAWRSAGKEVPVILEVAKDSPLLKSGRRRTVQLLEWNAGIDVKNVTLTDRKGVHMYWTYGFPQVRTTPNSADEVPTGVAADIVGRGGDTMLLIW